MQPSGCVKESHVMMRLKSREDAMMKTRKSYFPPILAIYLAVVAGFGALISTRIHAPNSNMAIEAQLVEPAQTSSL
jgi:predicted RND superfamily exporter protein